jgi:uncharacterized repeat protein (TIGR01451 family)
MNQHANLAALALAVAMLFGGSLSAQAETARTPSFEQILKSHAAYRTDRPELYEIAACLATVEAVKVAARVAHGAGEVKGGVLGAEFEFFLERADRLLALEQRYAGQVDSGSVAAFWADIQTRPQGQTLRAAMLDRLGNDARLAERCIALPALLDRIEFRAAHAGPVEPAASRGNACSVTVPNQPVPYRFRPTSIWTGAEIVYWGGREALGSGPFFNDGFIYDYATDSWRVLIDQGDVPSPRYVAYGLAAANQAIIYSGSDLTNSLAINLNTGGVLNLTTGEWTATNTTNAPVRWGATVLWSGSDMLYWGGPSTNVGMRYNPGSNSWTAMSTTGAPTARTGHSAVWTGSEMIIYGGLDGSQRTHTGARYNPGNNSWAAIRTASADLPSATSRNDHTAVWTGTEMLVFGGRDDNFDLVAQGLRYNLASNSWSTMATVGQPLPRIEHGAVWSGDEMLIWAGLAQLSSGSTAIVRGGSGYNPNTNSWRVLPIVHELNKIRGDFLSAWSGTEMLVFYDGRSSGMKAGEIYSPSGNSWRLMADGVVSPGPEVLAYWDFSDLTAGQSLADGQRILDACGNRDARIVATPAAIEGVRPGYPALSFQASSPDALVFEPEYNFGDGGPLAGTEFDFSGDANFTAEAIIRLPEGFNQVGSILAKDVGPGQASWWFRVNNGQLEGLVADGDNTQVIVGSQAVNDGQWHHVALVRDAFNGLLRLYVDYRQIAAVASSVTGDIATPSMTPVVVGAFNAGTRQLQGDVQLARVTLGRLLPAEFAISDEVANVAVSISHDGSPLMPGGSVSYEITVSNSGPATATNLAVSALMPSGFESAQWTCQPGAGASCTVAGSGDLIDTVDIPVNRSVIYTVQAEFDTDLPEALTYTAQIEPGDTIDFSTVDNSASATLLSPTIFQDRFESQE